ncbi:uncharacterized protein LOC110254160 [Paramuricea clavata]|uniref:Uncharacterized protein LOC110254160, partial n=2 Tax=Paramuricea clavata TaxID=317549 RepID=A0A6S7JCM8_PARCT|nr:uncharacterized protein LOC110254160 [Paramuricea clavata]
MEPPSQLPPHYSTCQQSLTAMMLTFKNLNIPLAPGKTQGPATVLEFMGIILDSVRMEARLPDDKIERLRAVFNTFQKRRSCTLKELQSLIGTLNFACKVIPPGRPYLQRMIELTRNIRQPHHHIKLSAGFFKDLEMWKQFIVNWNGASFFLSSAWENSECLQLHTDASGVLGYGGIFGGKWFQGKWEPHQQLGQPEISSIAWQELFAIVVACHIWGEALQNKRIILNCDNESVVNIINSKRSRISRVMDFLRHLTLLTLKYNIYLRAKHIPGKYNEIADSLSRFQFQRFRLLMPQADVNPQKIPVLLKNDIEYYIDLSVAASTKQTYSAGEKRFIAFVKLYRPHEGKHLLPTSEETLVQFSAYLAKTIKHTSIKNYLAAVRHFHIRNGFPLDCQKMSRLQLVLRGIKRSQGDEQRVRLPITIHHLKLFHMMLAIPVTTHFDSIMVWAAITLAFFCFLRLGELTCNSIFNSDSHLMPEDVVFSNDLQPSTAMSIRIKESKTDPFRVGHTISIGGTHTPLCPVLAMKEYLARRQPKSGPLFVNSAGKPLTKQALTLETRKLLSQAGFNASNFAGHSYRIGAELRQPQRSYLPGS